MRGRYVYKSKLKGRRSLCTAALFPQNDAITKVNLPRIVGLIDEIIIKRIHIEEKIRGHFYLCAYGVNDLSHLVLLISRNDKCPHDSRRIMPFVASVAFWFLAGKYALENSSIVCRVPR